MKIGVIREGKVPPDSRVPLTPEQCILLKEKFNHEVVVQPSSGRCINDEEYLKVGVPMSEDLSDCDILMGVKEVPKDQLIPDKVYFFFSHTIKEQVYNRDLLQKVLSQNIQLLDYEVLTDDKGKRLIAFGVFAGMVGAHNALWTYAQRNGSFEFPRMKDLFDYNAAKALYNKTEFPPVKIALTGSGRVGSGAAQVLRDMGIKGVKPESFLLDKFDYPVFTILNCQEYAAAKDGRPFVKAEFYEKPKEFKSIFAPYSAVADIMINGIYWDNDAPAFFTVEEMQSDKFNIKVIADVTCDIAPISSIPSTLFASTIADPIFGFDPFKNEAVAPHGKGIIDMMTIDNLPNELPRDASLSFGNQFLEKIAPELDDMENSDIIRRASVTKDGGLGECFGYLDGYVAGK